jgi:putative transposase
VVLPWILAFLAAVRVFLRNRVDVALEVLALRQEVAVLKRKRPRPALTRWDRFFWAALRHLWPRWSDVLAIVKPETVVGWHRAGFRLYWRWRSRPRGGRPKVSQEVRTLIGRLAKESSGWGAPKIHGELRKLGFEVCERTVARYLKRLRRRRDPGKSWQTFLANHREAIVAMDFFTVPTLNFNLLYGFFVIEHSRRRILRLQHHISSEFGMGSPTTARNVSRGRPVSLPDLGPRFQIRCRSDQFPDGHGPEAEADERSVALAKWNRRALGWKLPPGNPGPYHPAPRRASPPSDS